MTFSPESFLPELTAEQVTDALRRVPYPGLTRDLVSFGMVDHGSVCDRRVKVRLALVSHDASIPSLLESSITASLIPLGATTVAVEIVAPSAVPHPDEAVIAEGDVGIPTIIGRPDSASGLAFAAVARAVAESLGLQHVAAAEVQ